LSATRCFLWYGLVALVVLMRPLGAGAAERQIRPFIGVTFEGATTFVDAENAVGKPHAVIGVNAVWLREVVGVEVDLARLPGFFQADDPRHLVLSSAVTTLTGNLVVAAPGRKTEYGLRPYLVAGAGLMRVRIDHPLDVLPVAKNSPAIDIGGGVLGFITNKIGVSWDVRRFTSLSRSTEERGISIGGERLSFWRASTALAIRY
jgi:hypothetical protein